MQTEVQKKVNEGTLLEKGFQTNFESFKSNNQSFYDNAKLLLNELEAKYVLISQNLNFENFNDIILINSLTDLISKLRVSFTIYENFHLFNLKNDNVELNTELDKLNDFYEIYEECYPLINSFGKTK